MGGKRYGESIPGSVSNGMADESLEVTRFYISPMCSPTRASLMTGRYNFPGIEDLPIRPRVKTAPVVQRP